MSHYTEGRRYSHIHKAWILESGWNDSEEIAALRAQLAEATTQRDQTRDYAMAEASKLREQLAARDAEVTRLREAIGTVLDWSEFELCFCKECGHGTPVKDSDYTLKLRAAMKGEG